MKGRHISHGFRGDRGV